MAGADDNDPRPGATAAPVLGALWEAHRRWVAAVLLAHKSADAELEDLLQEVALSLVRSIADLKDPARLRPWLRAVAVNVARMDGRRLAARPAAARLPEGAAEPADPAAERARRGGEAAEELDAVLGLVRTLPAEQREVLLLKSVRGFSQRAIAETLDIPITTVETRLARARRGLRERREAQELARETARASAPHRRASRQVTTEVRDG